MKNIASPVYRLVAFLIELGVSLLILEATMLFVLRTETLSQMLDNLLRGLIILGTVHLGYGLVSLYLVAKFGGSIGKLLSGIRITNEQGNHISFGTALMRNWVGYWVSALFLWLGFVWIVIDRERRAWHDMLAQTFVVVVQPIGLAIGIIAMFLITGTSAWMATAIFAQAKSQIPLFQTVVQDVSTELANLYKNSPPEQKENVEPTSHESIPGRIKITLPADWAVYDIPPDATDDTYSSFLIAGYPQTGVSNLDSEENKQTFEQKSTYTLYFQIQKNSLGEFQQTDWENFRQSSLETYRQRAAGFKVDTPEPIDFTPHLGKQTVRMSFTFSNDSGIYRKSVVIINAGTAYYIIEINYPPREYSDAEKTQFKRDHPQEIATMLNTLEFLK